MEAFITYRSRLEFPDHMDGQPLDMPINAFAKVAEVLSHGNPPACILRGNEATLHPELDAILALTDKRALAVAVETCGLMPPESRRLLRERSTPVLWRLYHPRYYSDETMSSMQASLDEWLQHSAALTRLLIIVSDTNHAPRFALDYLERFPVRDVTFRVLCNDDRAGMREVTTFLAPHIPRLAAAGGTVSLDCGLPPCGFSDSDFGRLAKLGIHRLACNPRPGVLPDSRVYHCHRMMDYPQGQIAMFKHPGDIMDYFYRRHHFLQGDLRSYPDCRQCPCLRTGACAGFGLAAKAERLAEEAARLESRVAQEDSQAALVDLGCVGFELGRFQDAEHCLLEARRRDPANAEVHLLLARTYWEMGRAADSDDEYRKAARLAPEGREVLMELLTHYRGQGSVFKARRLAEEISRMGDQPGE